MFNYKLVVLVIFILSIYTIGFVNAENNRLPLFGKVIYLDPGHGGADPGALYKDLYESDLNLKIVNELAKSLEAKGAIVYQTRYGDYDLGVPYALNRKRSDLSRRGNIINRSLCDMYISIHLNAVTSSTWYGAQVFYDDINERNKEIAEIMQKALARNLRTRRSAKETSSMYLHKRVERPGILIEVGFITNPNERYLLKQETYQQRVANAVTSGVLDYFKDKQIKIGL